MRLFGNRDSRSPVVNKIGFVAAIGALLGGACGYAAASAIVRFSANVHVLKFAPMWTFGVVGLVPGYCFGLYRARRLFAQATERDWHQVFFIGLIIIVLAIAAVVKVGIMARDSRFVEVVRSISKREIVEVTVRTSWPDARPVVTIANPDFAKGFANELAAAEIYHANRDLPVAQGSMSLVAKDGQHWNFEWYVPRKHSIDMILGARARIPRLWASLSNPVPHWTRQPGTRGTTVSRTGTWPWSISKISGYVSRRANYGQIGHGKICLSSEEGSSWIVELDDYGHFDFGNISPGTYTLHTMDISGYQDTYYNPENQSVEKPTFQLKRSQRRLSVHLTIEPARAYRRVKGRVLGEDGKAIGRGEGLWVYAWTRKTQGRWKGHYRKIWSSSVRKDGSYLIDELDGRPLYVQVVDEDAQETDNPYPPRFYPGTFSRKAARLITFGDDENVIEDADITMQRSGGLVLKGRVANKSTGEPVTEALVSIFHFDMPFDLFCAYTDEQGHYRIEGLGEGKFIVHVDAVHRSFIKTRKLVDIKAGKKETEMDFALTVGVDISGRFTDEQGNERQAGRYPDGGARWGDSGIGGVASSFPYGNKYAPEYIRNAYTVFYHEGEGDNWTFRMAFPTKSTFLLPGVLPGKTTIYFSPRPRRIMHKGNDILETGLVTEPGQHIEGVTIVIRTR